MNVQKYIDTQGQYFWKTRDDAFSPIVLLHKVIEKFPITNDMYSCDACMVSPCWWISGQPTRHNTSITENILENLKYNMSDSEYRYGPGDMIPWYLKDIPYLEHKIALMKNNPEEIYIEAFTYLDRNKIPKDMKPEEIEKIVKRDNVMLLTFDIDTSEEYIKHPLVICNDAFTKKTFMTFKL